MHKIEISKTQMFLLFIIVWEAISVKILAYNVLPPKYFYDSLGIMRIMEGKAVADEAYTFTAQFFNCINIFKLTTHQGWSILLSTFGTIITMWIIVKNEKYTIFNTMYLFVSILFLNIYVFGISKDFIQYLFFLVIYIILSSNLNNTYKLIFICGTLIFEALNFRIYYGIMMILILTIYYLYKLFITKKINYKKIILLSIIIFFVEIFIVSLVSPENYNSILYARSGVNVFREKSLDAVTIINDLLGENSNFMIFMANYVINFIRLLFPIELVFKGIKYFPFIIYQIYISFHLFKALNSINNKNILWIATILSYIMISVIFEPDFGSFIRHESTAFLIMQYLVYKINFDGKGKYYTIY